MNQKKIRFGMVDIDTFRMEVPEGATCSEYDHGEQGKQIHIFYMVNEHEYRFTIDTNHPQGTAEEIAQELFAINGPLSIPEWCVSPYAIEESRCDGWVCGYGLMEGEGLRIHKVIFEQDAKIVTLTYSSPAAYFEAGLDVFEKIFKSFEIK